MIGFKGFCSGVLLSVMCLVSSAQAANVLYYFDSYSGTDYWVQAFATRGDTVTTAVDASDLVTQLAGGPWDFVVISENNNNHSATWATPIADYITAGGKVVLNDWYPNAIIDAATEVTDLNNDNQTVATINALGIATGLANGVAINPFTLTNAGWGVFSQALQPTGSAESRCDFPIGSCAVFGNSGRTMRLGFIPDGLPAADGAQILANAAQALFDAPVVGSYSVSGTISGLGAGLNVVLRLNGANDLTVAANGGLTFGTSIPNNSAYAVTVFTQPVGQTCTVMNGSGTSNVNITNVSITCVNGAVVPSTQPASIPTLSEWGMILLASLLAIWGAFTLQRRRNYL